MKGEMEKAVLLGHSIHALIEFVQKHYENENNTMIHSEKLYQVKLWVEEYKFQIIADELLRINRFQWNEEYTYELLEWLLKGMHPIEEYMNRHYDDVFFLSARIYTLKQLCASFAKRNEGVSRE